MEEINLLTKQNGWPDLQAVKSNQVHLCDFDLFTQPSPSTLTDGIEMLAALFHPALFKIPVHLKNKTRSFVGNKLIAE